jgi:elongation factor Ts
VQNVAHDLALHVASGAPRYLSPETIPAGDMAEQRAELESQLAAETKPEAIKVKIREGRLDKFYRTTCLLKQPYLKEDSLSVAAWLPQQGQAIGAPLRVVRFARFELES